MINVIDQLGKVKARITELETEEKRLADILKEKGIGSYEGSLFRATVSEFERSTLDMDAVRAKLSRQFIAANTNTTVVRSVRVVARNGVDVAA